MFDMFNRGVNTVICFIFLPHLHLLDLAECALPKRINKGRVFVPKMPILAIVLPKWRLDQRMPTRRIQYRERMSPVGRH